MSTRTRLTRLERDAAAHAPVACCVYSPEIDEAGNATGMYRNFQGTFTRAQCDERARGGRWIVMDEWGENVRE